MSQPVKDSKIIISGEEARKKLVEGAKAVHDTVGRTYGPRGANVLIEKTFGRPVLSRDGVTVARETYFKDRGKNMGAQAVLEAAETTNRIAGDGTSATTVLAYNLIKHGAHAISSGSMHPMEVKAALTDDSYVLLDHLAKLSKTIKKGQLKDVATVSSGDPLLGDLIAGAVDRVGADGGIITERAYIDSIEREYVDGYYLQPGFDALQAGKKELSNPHVIVSAKRIASVPDIAEIINNAALSIEFDPKKGQVLRLLFIGNFDEAAYNHIVDLINKAVLDAVVIKTPPSFGNMGKQLLEDIAIYAGCDLITDSTNLREFNRNFVGSVDKVVASKSEATLFADNKGETIQDRIAQIQEQIEVEPVDSIIEKLRDRKAKLEGKIALFKIGGATDTAREETEFRIEDAIQSTKAASQHGVVAGGGVTLLELSKQEISDTYKESLRDTFKLLLNNANLPVEIKLAEALQAPKGHGFNLRAGDSLVDMVEAGIVDPTLVLEQIIKNSTEVAANTLTTDTLLTFEDEEKQ